VHPAYCIAKGDMQDSRRNERVTASLGEKVGG